MHLGAAPPYLCLLRRNFCAAGGVLLWLQRCDFCTVKKPFPLTTAAQNMCNLCRKLLLLGNHFFVCWKTANFSTACGTVTLKSPLSRAFSVPHVHPRLRKCSPRCTLDCGLESVKKPRTAGLCGWAAGACDCGPLSSAKIERPSPLKKPSCKVRFFAQNRSCKYRQKVTATTLFQTTFHPGFQLLVQMAHVRFHG